ncbi:MAG: hypothetical protein ACREP8_05200, partial [Candidatus Binatia bacterium]
MELPADISWKGYSSTERDRRCEAVRQNASKAGFDCIFVPLCVDGRNLHLSLEQARGTRSDGRYLTQMENAAVVLPTDGGAPININDRGEGNECWPDARSVLRHVEGSGRQRGSWG